MISGVYFTFKYRLLVPNIFQGYSRTSGGGGESDVFSVYIGARVSFLRGVSEKRSFIRLSAMLYFPFGKTYFSPVYRESKFYVIQIVKMAAVFKKKL